MGVVVISKDQLKNIDFRTNIVQLLITLILSIDCTLLSIKWEGKSYACKIGLGCRVLFKWQTKKILTVVLNNPKHSLTKPISSRDGILLGVKYGGDGGAAAAKSAFSLQADIQNDDAPQSSSLI